MRTIEKGMVAAFMGGKNWKSGNTEVICNDFLRTIFLHGNAIAFAKRTNDSATWRLFISAATWLTNTTKSRLNALPGISIHQHKGMWNLNGERWNGEVVEVTNNYLPLN